MGGVHGAGVLRRNSGGDLGHSAGGAVDGLPTRTSQGDILSTAFLSHGDNHSDIMLFPCSVSECYHHGAGGF